MILCAGRNETFDFARPIGVGLIESAINLTKLVLEEKPAFLFLLEQQVAMETTNL